MLYPLDGEGIKFYGVNSMNEMKYLFKNTNVIFFLQKMNSMKDDSYGIGMTMHILPHWLQMIFLLNVGKLKCDWIFLTIGYIVFK